jgi:hypothetical protein
MLIDEIMLVNQLIFVGLKGGGAGSQYRGNCVVQRSAARRLFDANARRRSPDRVHKRFSCIVWIRARAGSCGTIR